MKTESKARVNFIVSPPEEPSSFPLTAPPHPLPPPPPLPILVARLIGCPIRRWVVNPGWCGGRVAAIQVEPETGLIQFEGVSFPPCTPNRGRVATTCTIPVPVYNSCEAYHSGFVETMRNWANHLLGWRVTDNQVAWYQTGENLAKTVLRQAKNLYCWSDEDQAAMERLLLATLSFPRQFVDTAICDGEQWT